MKVRATGPCYYGDVRRKEGEVFFLKPRKIAERMNGKPTGKMLDITAKEQFNADFMEMVDASEPVQRPAKEQNKRGHRSDMFLPQQPSVARAAHEPREESPDVETEESESVI